MAIAWRGAIFAHAVSVCQLSMPEVNAQVVIVPSRLVRCIFKVKSDQTDRTHSLRSATAFATELEMCQGIFPDTSLRHAAELWAERKKAAALFDIAPLSGRCTMSLYSGVCTLLTRR